MDMRQKTLFISPVVHEFLRPCDFVVGNFEATMTTARKPRLTAQSQNVSILDSLARCFPPERTFLSLANNHAGDFPAAVFRTSLDSIEQKGFHVFGLVQAPFVDIGGYIRVVGASMWSNRPFSEIVPFGSVERYCGKDVFNIAFPHWGYELELFPRPAIVQLSQHLLQRYDAIIGHHSHVPQPLTAFESGDTWKLTAFSLGDFCTGLRMRKYQFGMICKMDIGPGKGGLLQAGAVEWCYTKVSSATPETMEVRVVSDVLP
ncbi:MAG: CapA family protein [Pseudomonadota bacterium]